MKRTMFVARILSNFITISTSFMARCIESIFERLLEGDGFPTSKQCLMEFLWAAVNILTRNNEDIWQ